MLLRMDVPHDGKLKMVGKLFEHGGRHYFLHEERKQSQAHHKLNSPGGIDTCVIRKLRALAPVIGEVTVIHRNQTGSWTATAEAIEHLGQRVEQGGRDRIFLEWGFWTPTTTRITVNPHATQVDIVEPLKTSWAPLTAPPPAAAPDPQKGLFA